MADDKKKDAKEEGKEEAKEEGKGKEKEEKKDEKKEGDATAAEGGAAAEGDGDGKKKKKKMILLIAIALLVVIAVAVPAVLYITGFFNKKAEVTEQTGEDGKAVSVGPDGAIEQPVFYDMAEFIVNLNVGSKRPSFLKMTISLEIPGESQVPRIEEKMPRIRDSFQVYLRELRQEDLQGSAGLYRLREELLLRINKVVYPAKVNDILFKEILVQ